MSIVAVFSCRKHCGVSCVMCCQAPSPVSEVLSHRAAQVLWDDLEKVRPWGMATVAEAGATGATRSHHRHCQLSVGAGSCRLTGVSCQSSVSCW